MSRVAVIAACGLISVAVVGASQQPPAQTPPAGQRQAGPPPPLLGPVVEVRNIFNSIKTNITAGADQFPEAKYDWAPTPEVRSFGQLIEHIIDDNNGFCFALAGEPTRQPALDQGGKPTDAGKGLKKAQIVTMLAESFARCDKAFAAVTPENMLERASPVSSRSKLGALFYNTQHINEHYGNIVTYMRLQGLVPPSSQPRGRGGI